MKTDHKNGDMPVYPGDGGEYHEGLTKREWFAGMALNGMAVNGWGVQSELPGTGDIADACVRMADALLAELDKKKP